MVLSVPGPFSRFVVGEVVQRVGIAPRIGNECLRSLIWAADALFPSFGTGPVMRRGMRDVT